MQDRVFLDTSVLLPAAIRPGSNTFNLLLLGGAHLMTSVHAVEEARRNVATEDQRQRLADVLALLEIRNDQLMALPDWLNPS